MCHSVVRNAVVKRPTASYIILTCWLAVVFAAVFGSASRTLQQYHSGRSNFNSEGPDILGVSRPLQLFAKAPINNHTTNVMLTIWLRRVGRQAGYYGLPHQEKDTLRGFLWVEDVNDLRLKGLASHLQMPIRLTAWKPRLLLQLAYRSDQLSTSPTSTLEFVINTEYLVQPSLTDPIRPISFHVDLPAGVRSCFKILEASFPEHRVPFCAPPHPHVCASLAPPGRFTDQRPALWSVIGPLRDYSVKPGQWDRQMRDAAVLVHYYLSYHLAVGITGLLLYADQLSRSFFLNEPLLAPLFEAGTLRLVRWDLMERENAPVDGYNGYNYDQAVFSSHALLGLSPCGTNLRILLTDIDEFVHIPSGQPWPAPASDCMPTMVPGRTKPGVIQFVRRFNVQSSTVPTDAQPALWELPPSSSSVILTKDHPLTKYDLIQKVPFEAIHSKCLATPAGELVAFFVHEAWPLHGEGRYPPFECMMLLHVRDMFFHRHQGGLNTSIYNPLQLQLFSKLLG